MKIVTIHVPMCTRDSLLLPYTGTGEGHRGVWFYDPTVYGEIGIGDQVSFQSAGGELVRAVVTGFLELNDVSSTTSEFKKYCSRVNGKCFTWLEIRPTPLEAIESAQSGMGNQQRFTGPGNYQPS